MSADLMAESTSMRCES